MQQQQCLQTPSPRKKKEKAASPWWDFLSHCKEAAESSDSEHDDLSYAQYCNDMICTAGATNTADDGPIIKETAALSPESVARTTPVKLISGSRSNNYVSGENDVTTARPETPGTQDSSFSSLETSSSSSSVPDNNDMRELSFESIEKEEGEIEEGEEEECNFIGNIEIKPISPLLSTQQRSIRKNAYDLLKRLGEEGSAFDAHNVVAEDGREEEEGYNHATKNDDNNVTSMGINNVDDNNDDDIMADLHAEIANLTNRLQAATLQSTQDASKIKSLEAQLQQALNKLNEYEETIDSVNEAVDRCHSYNEEIVKELVVSRKENDDLTMRLLNHEQERKEKEEEEHDCNELPSSEGDTTTTSPAVVTCTGDSTDEDAEASFVEDDVENENDDATTITTSSPTTCDQFPSVFHHRQQPLSALQDHLLSCIKLPLRVVSILFSVWLAIILLRIVFIFSLVVVDHNSLLENDGFNTPGIY